MTAVLPRLGSVTVSGTAARCCIPDTEGYIDGTVQVCGSCCRRVAVAGTMAGSAIVTGTDMERMPAGCRRNGMTTAAVRYRRSGRGSAGLR